MKSDAIQKKLKINESQLHAYSTGLLQGTAYSRLHVKVTRALLPFGISIPEWKLLGQVHEHGKMRLSGLAEYLSYDPPMVTKLAKKLEKKSLIIRLQDDRDERAKVISITTKGTKLIEAIEPEVKKAMAVLLQGVSRAELLTYLKVLRAIVNNSQE